MGHAEPISLRDPDLGLARLRANGRYSMAISDPQMFVAKIVGTQGLYQTSQIEDYLRSMIISRLTDLLGESKTGLFDLPGLFNEMSAAIKVKVSEDFEALGITLKQMFLASVSPTEETQKAIDERAAMGAIGDMNKYMQYSAAKAMREASASGGEAGSAASTGVGLGAGMGMGVGMAGMISQAMAGTTQQQAAPAAAAAAAPAATPDVMTVAEAAAYLKVSPADIQALITPARSRPSRSAAISASARRCWTISWRHREG